METKQTAVEWFFRWVNDNPEATHKEYSEAFKQAKEMEKQQIIDAHDMGYIDGGNHKKVTAEMYFAKTYESKGSDDTKTN